MSFKEELDMLLLADLLHDKKCVSNHSVINTDYCDYHMHNKRKELMMSVNQVTSMNKYHKQAKEILRQCEHMSMKEIINLVKTIIE